MEDERESDIRVELEEMLQRLEEERYLQLSGAKPESRRRALFSRRSDLLDPANWRAQAAEGLTSGRGELERLFTHACIDASMAGPLDSLLHAETTREISIGGAGKTTLRRAPVQIAGISERPIRAEAYSAWLTARSGLSSFSEDALANANTTVRALGFESLADAVEGGMGLPLSELSENASALIDVTEDIYTDILSWVIKKNCRVSLERAEEHDLFWLGGPCGPVSPVSFEHIHGLIAGRIASTGIESRADGRLAFDMESRDGKIVEPLCVPLRVPGRVIVLGERRDSLDYARLHTHELGRGLTYALLERSLPFELRCLMDPAVPHAWGYLLDGVFLEKKWTESLGDCALRNSWLPLGGALDLMRHRVNSAFVLALAEEGGGPELGNANSRMTKRALGLEPSVPMLFRSLDDLLGPVHRLRGLALGLSLRAHFRERFGEDWSCDAGAGALMLSLWEGGGSWTPDRLADALGLVTAKPGALVEETERALGKWQ